MAKDGQATYYDAGGIESLDVIKAKLTQEQWVGFLLGTAIKYNLRLNFKGQGPRDAQKAAFYAARLSEALAEAPGKAPGPGTDRPARRRAR